MNIIGSYAVPLVISAILIAGLFRTSGMFGQFTSGALDGMKVLMRIVPSLVGLITAVEMFKASGALDVLTFSLSPVASFLHLPKEIMPLMILRPISGGGAVAMLDRLLSSYGPNSLAGRVACVMCGSSETTFYTTTLYYGAVGVKKIRHTLVAALIADFCGMVISGIAVNLLF